MESIGPGKVYLNWISKQTGTSLEIVTVICSIFHYLLDLWPIPELFVEGVQTFWHQSEFVLARRSQIFNTGWSLAIAVYDVLGARLLTVWRHNIVSGKTVYALWRHFKGSVAVVWRQLRSQCDDSLTTPLWQYDGSVTVCDDRTTKSLPVMRGSLRRHELD